MELVTLAHAQLKRIGSALSPGMGNHKSVSRLVEVPDGGAESLREVVVSIAEEHGETRDRLQTMWLENAWNYTQQRGAVVFNIQGRNTSYSDPYAVCFAYPALKIDGRYFKLEEVER